MKISHSSYLNTDAEFQECCAFLNHLSKLDPHMHWESGRMNYWRADHGDLDHDDPFFCNNAHIWRADGQGMVALCISEYGRNDMFIEVLPDYHQLYPDLFAWIHQTWATGRPSVEIDVFSNDTHKIALLEEQGYTFTRHFENKRYYNLNQIDLKYRLEDGFKIVTFSESQDFAGKAALVRSAFNHPDYDETRIHSLVQSADYVSAYDLMVVSPEGQPAAYCTGWREQTQENAGYIEPVGTHADFRQRGFAKSVIRECFKRMKADGIKVVEIASRAEPNVSNYLYDSLQPFSKREIHKYSKLL